MIRPDQVEDSYDLSAWSSVLDSNVRIFDVQERTPYGDGLIGLKKVNGIYYIFGEHIGPKPIDPPSLPPPSTIHLLGTDGKLHSDPTPPHVPLSEPKPKPVVSNCKAQIDSALADRLVRSWDSVVLETRPEAAMPLVGPHGGFEHFGSNMESGVVAGFTFGPSPGTRPAWLGTAAYDLMALCWKWHSPGGEPTAELERVVGRLEVN